MTPVSKGGEWAPRGWTEWVKVLGDLRAERRAGRGEWDPWELASANVNRRSEGKPWGQGCSRRCVSSSCLGDCQGESCRERDWERCPWESGLTQTLPCSAVGLSWRTYGGAGPGLVAALYKGLCAWVPRVLCASRGYREAGWPNLWLHVLCSCGTGMWLGTWAGCGLAVG